LSAGGDNHRHPRSRVEANTRLAERSRFEPELPFTGHPNGSPQRSDVFLAIRYGRQRPD
jgi:hypothetical protein